MSWGVPLTRPEGGVRGGETEAVGVVAGAEDVWTGDVWEDLHVVDLFAGVDVFEFADKRAGLPVDDDDATVDARVSREWQIAEGVRATELAAADEEVVAQRTIPRRNPST